MTGEEAIFRVKTGKFNNNFGFDMQILIDAVGTLGEMFRSGQIIECVRCENCKFAEKQLFGPKEDEYKCTLSEYWGLYDFHNKDWYCPDGKRREVD